MDYLDQRAFGQLEGRFEVLERLVKAQGEKIDELLALANRSRGGFWVGAGIASIAGSVGTFLVAALAGWRPH